MRQKVKNMFYRTRLGSSAGKSFEKYGMEPTKEKIGVMSNKSIGYSGSTDVEELDHDEFTHARSLGARLSSMSLGSRLDSMDNSEFGEGMDSDYESVHRSRRHSKRHSLSCIQITVGDDDCPDSDSFGSPTDDGENVINLYAKPFFLPFPLFR